eukprot:5582839-Amphidinium_carterae.1
MAMPTPTTSGQIASKTNLNWYLFHKPDMCFVPQTVSFTHPVSVPQIRLCQIMFCMSCLAQVRYALASSTWVFTTSARILAQAPQAPCYCWKGRSRHTLANDGSVPQTITCVGCVNMHTARSVPCVCSVSSLSFHNFSPSVLVMSCVWCLAQVHYTLASTTGTLALLARVLAQASQEHLFRWQRYLHYTLVVVGSVPQTTSRVCYMTVCARDASLICAWNALLYPRILVKSSHLLACAVFFTDFWCQAHLNRQFQGSACSNLMDAGPQLRIYTIGLNNFESLRGDRYGELKRIYEASHNISLRDDYEYDTLLRVLRKWEPAIHHRMSEPAIDRQDKRGIFLNLAG